MFAIEPVEIIRANWTRTAIPPNLENDPNVRAFQGLSILWQFLVVSFVLDDERHYDGTATLRNKGLIVSLTKQEAELAVVAAEALLR